MLRIFISSCHQSFITFHQVVNLLLFFKVVDTRKIPKRMEICTHKLNFLITATQEFHFFIPHVIYKSYASPRSLFSMALFYPVSTSSLGKVTWVTLVTSSSPMTG